MAKRDYSRTPAPRRVAPALTEEQARSRDPQCILIVTEGKNSEVSYFEHVRNTLRIYPQLVEVYHPPVTDPVNLVREALDYRERRSRKAILSAFEETWVVFDRESEHHPRRKQIKPARDLARDNNIRIAFSIPSLEYWLLIHFEDTLAPFADSDHVIKELRKHISNYDKSPLPPSQLRDLIAKLRSAITRAQRGRKQWRNTGGDRNPSTNIDRLIYVLNRAARAAYRWTNLPPEDAVDPEK